MSQSDAALIQELRENLKNAFQDGNAVAAVAANYGYTYVDALKDVGNVAISLAGLPIKKAVEGIGALLSIAAKKTGKAGLDAALAVNAAAKAKGRYRGIILDNRKKIDDLKEKLNNDAIQTAVKEGVSFTQSLQSVGSNGSYKAADWVAFAAQCESRLKERSERASEKANNLFNEVYPALKEGLVGVFTTFLADIDTLEKFKGQLSAATVSVYEALAKDEKVVEALDGPNKDRAKAELTDIRKQVQETIDGFYNALKEGQAQMEES